MDLAHFRILIHELLNKDPDIVPDEAPLIILDSNYTVCMANKSKDTKHTRHSSRRVHFHSNSKNSKCIILTDMKEVCNWQTLQLAILGRII